MRIALATTAALFCTTSVALADPELTLSVGVMERSFTEGTDILFAAGTTLFSSDDIDASGISIEAQIMGDGMWGRALVYSDSFDQRVNDAGFGMFFNLAPLGFGLPNAGTTTDFTRETSLTRFDFMTEVAQVSGVDIYAGGSLAQISDDLGGFMQFGGTNGTFAWEGSTQMIGAVVGARYDHAPSAGSSGITLSTFGTLGIYHATHSMDYTFPPSGHDASAEDSGVTGAAEIGISLGYAFSENSELSLTYQAAFYGDAIDSISAINATTSSPSVTTQATTSSVLYHGLSASYVFRF